VDQKSGEDHDDEGEEDLEAAHHGTPDGRRDDGAPVGD